MRGSDYGFRQPPRFHLCAGQCLEAKKHIQTTSALPKLHYKLLLQTTGEAVYTSDFGSDAAQLFASTVESTEPLAYIRAIDASPALEVCTIILPTLIQP